MAPGGSTWNGADSAAAEWPRAAAELPGRRFRAGERALLLLATPLNFLVLRALAERPMRLAELRRATGLPAQTTLRGHLASLCELGVIDKRQTAQMPYAVENELTAMGRDLLTVANLLEHWLAQAPDGPVALEAGRARGVVKAFVDGWASTMMRGLAARPMSLTELDRGITELSYPALERRLSSMRMAGLIEARPSHGVGTPYAVTDWARRGIAPLALAADCERVHMRNRAAPLDRIDIEAAFLLALPLVGLAPDVAGCSQLEVEADPRAVHGQAGVRVTVERGRVVDCDSELGPSPGDFAVGSAAKWFSAIKDGTASLLRFGGGQSMAEHLVTGLHAALMPR
jgi:DNA-binding HxlR family transcriptional regulator